MASEPVPSSSGFSDPPLPRPECDLEPPSAIPPGGDRNAPAAGEPVVQQPTGQPTETTAAPRHPLERVAAYPRPPALVACDRAIRVEVFGRVLCETRQSLRVLETHHPPTFYVPPDRVDLSLLAPTQGRSFCEWKGVARYFDLVCGDQRRRGAVWQYPEPTPAFRELAGWFALYPALVDGCWLDGELVRPQPGGFYGGWISSDLIGPFKGDPLHPELI